MTVLTKLTYRNFEILIFGSADKRSLSAEPMQGWTFCLASVLRVDDAAGVTMESFGAIFFLCLN